MVAPGETLAHRYRIVATLGEGGLARTFLARDLVLEADVALKVLRRAEDEWALRAELGYLAGLVHPHLVRVLDFGSLPRDGEHAALHYLATEVVAGRELDRAAPSFEALRGPLVDALSALAFLHRLGLRHGDFKPANVMVDERGRGVLLDLSCAGLLGSVAVPSGTPRFIAPEVLRGERADARSDLFAVGVTLLDLAREHGLPPLVERLARRLADPDPAARPASAEEVIEALGGHASWIHVPPREAPRLVGREAELGLLVALLDGLEAGRAGPRVAIVRGPEGAGRSRLLRELKWIAQTRVATVEALATTRRPFGSLVERAAAEPLAEGNLRAALEARDRLVRRGTPVALLVDDVHLLPDDDREALSALARSLDPADPVLLVVTEIDHAKGVFLGESAGATGIGLRPLTAHAVKRWMLDVGLSGVEAELFAATGGHPAAIAEVVAELQAGSAAEGELDRAVTMGRLVPKSARAAVTSAFPPAEERALALLVALSGRARLSLLSSLGVDEVNVSTLVGRGLARRDADALRITRREAATLAVSDEAIRAAHAAIAASFDARSVDPATSPEERLEAAGQAVRHWALAGRANEATRRLAEHGADAVRQPRAFRGAAEAVVDAEHADDEVWLLAVRVIELGGHPARAREAIERRLPRLTSGAPRGGALLTLASCLAQQGEAQRALTVLAEAAREPLDEVGRARRADLEARALTRLGRHAEARVVAEAALEAAPALPDDDVRADLIEDLVVAATHLGDLRTARKFLSLSAAATARSPRRLLRARSYRAIHDYRAGDVRAALAGHREALWVAEEHGLSDAIARTCLNLGTACHQLGKFAEALEAYERGARVSRALGQQDVGLLFASNLAKLWADVGAFERGLRTATRTEADATAAGLVAIAAAAASAVGENAFGLGDLAVARDAAERARGAFDRLGMAREAAEVALERADIDLAAGDLSAAARALDAVAGEAREAPDVAAREALGRAELDRLRGAPASGLSRLEEALSFAERAGQPDLIAVCASRLAAALDPSGERARAIPLRARADALWEEAVSGLAPELRSAFFAHPRRRLRTPVPLHLGGAPQGRMEKLSRLLDLYRKLNGTDEANGILVMALDAAIELTGAERGFLVLEDPRSGALHVPAARNVDREQIGKSHLKFSRSIAEQAMRTAQPVCTADAREDERFRENASVHAMRLRSVIAVPIRSPDGVIGALYLDNRFTEARFREADIDLVLGFADHVALVLRRARLIEDLRRRTEELEAERSKVEELARLQAAEIVRLGDEVRAKQEALDHRHDDRGIIGRSPALRRVFATLDRVVTSPLPVLVLGESGTGKELVARAVHDGSPRRAGPFVGINCAALPASLLEAELFGHKRGAFTGADRDRGGLMVAASGGTLFLDELGEMPLEVQAKLLRVLQERVVRPLGSDTTVPVDFRLVCATNRTLRTEVRFGRFREDLYYRVGVVEVTLPPLRDRLEDLPELAAHLVSRAARELSRPAPRITPSAMRVLLSHSWPGNVRELENVLMKAIVLAEGDVIRPGDLGLRDARPLPSRHVERPRGDAEREAILRALAENGWNAAQAARSLAIPRATFYRRLERYGIARPR
ncbi:sigma 54-interacting transcriptional regulator [Polyangium jinanense]|uniref:Sigma 54-interacting transcriptional regulator n=1 Tax=Polyangium jinanense TaxID=2829994 RepID=A0A9X3XHF7_9BACT|nr:sigma 54-interacting transcriptional regulator [Polyangium jinanense]MDC3988196.1 sigma 54-interacting transcriptional regulator [Polyangium jinanense]